MPSRTRKLLSYVIDQLHAPEPPDIYTVPWEALAFLGAPLPHPMPYSSVVVPGGDPIVISYEQHIWGGAQVTGGQVVGEFYTPYPSGGYVSGEGGLFVREMPGSAGNVTLELPGALAYRDAAQNESVAFSDAWQIGVDAPPLDVQDEACTVAWTQWTPGSISTLETEEGEPFFPGVPYTAQAVELFSTGYSEPLERVTFGVSPGGQEKIYDPKWVPYLPGTYGVYTETDEEGNSMITGVTSVEPLAPGTYIYKYVGPYVEMEFSNVVRIASSEALSEGGYLNRFVEPELVLELASHFTYTVFSFGDPFKLTEKLTVMREPFIRIKEELVGDTLSIRYGVGFIAHWIRYAKLATDVGDGNGYVDVRPSGSTDEDGFVFMDSGEYYAEPGALQLADKVRVTGERPNYIKPLDTRLQGRLRIRTKMPDLPRFAGELTDELHALLDVGPGVIHTNFGESPAINLFNPLLSSPMTHDFYGLQWTGNEYAASAFLGNDVNQIPHLYAVVIYKADDYRVQVSLDGTPWQEWSLWDFFPQAREEDGQKRLYYSDGSPTEREAGDYWPQPSRLNLLPNYDFAHTDFPFRLSCRVGPFRVRARAVEDKLGKSFTAAAQDSGVTIYLESFYPQSESPYVQE